MDLIEHTSADTGAQIQEYFEQQSVLNCLLFLHTYVDDKSANACLTASICELVNAICAMAY
jgi:hypothetical protein